MRVLLTVASFEPGYGGPAVSVGELAGMLARLNATVGVWAPDASQTTSTLIPTQPNLVRLSGAIRDVFVRFRPLIAHDNGVWLNHNHRIAMLAREFRIPRVVSLRGMLEPWARQHKNIKKTIAWTLYQRSDLMKAQCHHATAEREAGNIESYGLGVPVVSIPNGVNVPDAEHIGTAASAASDDVSAKVALFLGRLHPVKGLPVLIDAWARVRPLGWKLRIIGPDEGGYRASLEKHVQKKKLGASVEFSPAVAPANKGEVYASANLVILPSVSESFGMVVAEALAYGVPVVTTTGTPWAELDDRGCGWCVPPTLDGIEDGLRRATATAREELARMGSIGREWVRSEFGWDGIGIRFLELYEALLSQGMVRPDELKRSRASLTPKN